MGVKRILKKHLAKAVLSRFVILGLPAIIRNSRGEILLGKRNKNAPFYPNRWGLPGGIVDKGETIEKAIKREVKEEIGVDSEILKCGKNFMQMPTKECSIQALNIPVYCKILKNQKPKPKDETSEVDWFSPKEIKKMNLAYSHKEILKQEGLLK